MDTFHESHPSHVIVPKVCSRKNVFIYEYPKVKHGPLTQQMAILCLKAFIMKQALDELHEKGASCNDLRLPNMCFNEQYEAVLIDLERCYDINQQHPFLGALNNSCMYNFESVKSYGQLTHRPIHNLGGWWLGLLMTKQMSISRYGTNKVVESRKINLFLNLFEKVYMIQLYWQLVLLMILSQFSHVLSYCRNFYLLTKLKEILGAQYQVLHSMMILLQVQPGKIQD